MLLIFFSFACKKSTEPQTTVDQSTIGKQNDTQPQVADRSNCCCNVVVSSTFFNGLTICGVLVGNTCTVSSGCGNTCGNEQVVPAANKTALFCWDDTCPVCFHNDGTSQITIYFSCGGGSSNTFTIPALSWRCYTGDCNGNFTECAP